MAIKIIAHRGFWKTKKEQNTLLAFKRAADCGFGVETDLREYKGRLVISHDIAGRASPGADQAFKIFSRLPPGQMLAVNIKSDGLCALVKNHLKRHKIKNYFIFDASLPETLHYLRSNMRLFLRRSEFEPQTDFIKKSSGIWLDSFNSVWYTEKTILKYVSLKLPVCVVSPELHGRPYQRVWKMLKSKKLRTYARQIFLCTDFPQRAREFFDMPKAKRG